MTGARPWPGSRDLVAAALLALLAVPTLFLGLGTPAFMDNESRYAEVAREMLLSGDWMTPRLNFTVFLNKPPLAYWLTALTFEAVGINEYGRLWVALTALGTLGVTFLLGRTLGGSRVGLLSSLVLLTSAGFFLEGRTLRPDLLLVLLVSTALLGFLKASQARTIRDRTLWVYLSVFALALSVLAKGLVGVALVGATTGLTLLLGDRPAPGWRQVRWWPALLIVLAVILPWYLVTGLRNPGFWWDSIVNQHVLALVDRKLPRDSRPDSLLYFWGAFLIRTLPWCIYLPVALLRAVRILRHSRTPGKLLPAIWFGVVLAFFSLMPSRLRHYSLPALPAVALLVGGWWAEVIERRGARSVGALVAGASLVLIAVTGFVTVPWVVRSQAWAQGFPELTRPAALVFGLLIVGTGAALGSVWRGRPGPAFALLLLTILPQFFFVHRSLALIEPVNSWKSVGMAISRLSPRDGEVIFAASEEYQLCAGVNFYTGRPLSVWLPDGYVPPTYLDLGDHTVFLTRSEFLRRWQADRTVLLVVDPGRRAGDPAALVPAPVWVVGRWGDRVLLANRPVSPTGGQQ
ncbi:MAG: glycosyltransferase family 39 protein [Candidatus Rokubacteria bacterium]|nr:glycosyltransferase family 39 protein [Candidatus Rokubacteria bacterium]